MKARGKFAVVLDLGEFVGVGDVCEEEVEFFVARIFGGGDGRGRGGWFGR